MATNTYTEVDGQCSICRSRTEVTAYRMYATCQNCGTQVIAKLSRGHDAHHLAAECPACGNRHWTILIPETQANVRARLRIARLNSK